MFSMCWMYEHVQWVMVCWMDVWTYKEMGEWKRDGWMQWYAGKHTICWETDKQIKPFLVLASNFQCTYSNQCWFQATHVTSLNTELGRDVQNRCLQVYRSQLLPPIRRKDGGKRGGRKDGEKLDREERRRRMEWKTWINIKKKIKIFSYQGMPERAKPKEAGNLSSSHQHSPWIRTDSTLIFWSKLFLLKDELWDAGVYTVQNNGPQVFLRIRNLFSKWNLTWNTQL